jgi:diguanylate cyclase (GGDEF)-like protein/PAS domain S-box-containing protein
MGKDKEINELRKTVEELLQVKEKLRRSEEMYKFLAENSIDAIWQLDSQMRFVYVSAAVKAILGYQPEEIVGQSLFSILTQESAQIVIRGYANRKELQETGQIWGSSVYTVETVHKDGRHIWAEVTVNPIFGTDNRLLGFNGITRDISERRRNEEVLREHAFRDPLTNLPNRWMFEEVLKNVAAKHRDLNKPFAIMFLDVDGLKKINDAYGHSAGDELLKTVAERLCDTLSKEDFVARLAGDEFMAILPSVANCHAAKLVATRLTERFQQAIKIGGTKARIGVSMGLSFFPEDTDDINMLMKFADQAMYKAKKNGGNSYVCYRQTGGNGLSAMGSSGS